jgi:hypothetical protein
VLKSLIELGLPGLLIWAYLWFQIALTGYRTYRSVAREDGPSPGARVLLWGILTSLMIAFFEGWVYQNLEGKQVNAYFWVMVGLLGFLSHRSSSQGSSSQQPLWPPRLAWRQRPDSDG